ncbi:hypothetical protein LTR85_007457 [Meristemomyces frigidus]|nr:hypothetical protein LTR85_007457 [Meristemomyces frigidus]
MYFSPGMVLIEGRGGLLRKSLVVNMNRVRPRACGDPRDKVFALYGTLRQLGVILDAPQYAPEVTVAHVYQRFTICFIQWHRTLDILVEACYPPPSSAPTWVPDLRRPYKRWDIQKFRAAGDSRPDYRFMDDRTLHTTGMRLGRVWKTWVDREDPSRRRYFTDGKSYTGASPAPVEPGDIAVLISGLRVPMILRPAVAGFTVVGMAEVDGVMEGAAWKSPLAPDSFTLI